MHYKNLADLKSKLHAQLLRCIGDPAATEAVMAECDRTKKTEDMVFDFCVKAAEIVRYLVVEDETALLAMTEYWYKLPAEARTGFLNFIKILEANAPGKEVSGEKKYTE